MAMSGAGLKNAVIAAVNAEFGTELEDMPDNHELTDYDRATYQDRYWDAVATAIVVYIQANANAIGSDSRGDTHNLTIT